jgi:hypothetical protein
MGTSRGPALFVAAGFLALSCRPFSKADGPPGGAATDGAAAADSGAPFRVLKTIATGRTSPVGISVIGANVYWAETTDRGRVFSAPKGGGPPTTVGDGPNRVPWTTSDGFSLFWINDSLGQCDDGTGLFRQTATAAPPTRLYYCDDVVSQPARLVADSVRVYWTGRAFVRSTSATAVGSSTDSLPGDVHDPPAPGALAIGLSAAYVFFSFDKGIGRATKDLSSWALHATTGASGSPALVVDEDNVYYAAPDAIMKAPVATPDAATPFAAEQPNPLALALHGDTVYWTTGGIGNDGSVRSRAKAGGAVQTIAPDQPAPTSIAADADGVYWTCADGSIRQASR